METAELTGAALDWAVAKCEGYEGVALQERTNTDWYSPSTDWSQGGPIIEREKMDVCVGCDIGKWYAMMNNNENDDEDLVFMQGSTPLEAAMRCYVTSKLGDDIDVPNELTGE